MAAESDGVVVLLSGGMDSTALLGLMTEQFTDVFALHIRYGSRHEKMETEAANKVAAYYGLDSNHYRIYDLPDFFKGSALIDQDLPMGRSIEEMSEEAINPTYVPMRNTVLTALAGSWADTVGGHFIAYAAHATDGSHYIDTRPEFFAAMNAALVCGSENQIQLLAPFINRPKNAIVTIGATLKAPLHLTYSCYAGGEAHCGQCDTCAIRIKAFAEAGFRDPVQYPFAPADFAGLEGYPVFEKSQS